MKSPPETAIQKEGSKTSENIKSRFMKKIDMKNGKAYQQSLVRRIKTLVSC
jgi:hypothetical protein